MEEARRFMRYVVPGLAALLHLLVVCVLTVPGTLNLLSRQGESGGLAVVAGLFLIFPGVVSDLIALTLLLLPSPRVAADPALRRDRGGTLIEGEFRRSR